MTIERAPLRLYWLSLTDRSGSIEARMMRRAISQLNYTLSCLLNRPTGPVLDRYFNERVDCYLMNAQGGPRFEAIASAILENFGPCDSLLDASIYEGVGAATIANRIGARRIVGFDLSGVAIERARERCAAFDTEFHRFDLGTLMAPADQHIPGPRCDIVLVSEVLYSVGPFARYVWKYPDLQRAAKRRLLSRLGARGNKGMIVQHYGAREKQAIEEVAKDLGGLCVNREFGIIVIPPTC